MSKMKNLIVKTIPILHMDCPTCIPVLENEVKRLRGVEEARGSYMTKTLRVTYNPDLIQLSEIETAIERVGYQIAYKKYPSVISRIRGLVQKEKPSKIEIITDRDFLGRVIHASKTVAVLFMTPSCPTCRVLKPTLEEAAKIVEGKADLYMMDIASTDTWRKYDILTVPTILVFRNGEVKQRMTSLPSREDIEKALSS